jgi:hypothetical protein
MNLKTLAIAASAMTAVLAASAAYADPPRHARAYGWEARHEHHGHRSRPTVVYAPAPVYYAPAPLCYGPPPVYYVPPPVSYAPPAPVLYGHVPVAPGLRVSFGLRL